MAGATKFPIDAAQMVGLFMESVFYGFFVGVFLVSFFTCMRALLWSEGWFKAVHLVNKKMLIAALSLFTFASMDVAFHLQHNLEAFVYYNSNPIETFEQTSTWINVMAMVCYVGQTFVGDTILLYRCWVVYNKNWYVVVFPTILWLGTTACGIMTVYVEATIDTSGKLLDSSGLVPFITSMLCLTLTTNVITTSLIVYRIWKIQSSLKRRSIILSSSPLTNVVLVLIESGVMYTVSIIILFGLYLASNNGQYGVSDAIVQIIGITFNMIITSVNRGDSTMQSLPYSHNSHLGRQTTEGSVPLHLINIHTTVARYPDPSPSEKLDDLKLDNGGSDQQQWETR